MAVLDPIKVVIENYPEGQVEWFDMPFSQDGSVEGSRKVPFSRELYIERDDFREDPPKKFHRLFPGSEVRLRYAYYVTCKDVIKDADGNIVELRCTYDPESKGGATPDGRKIKGTIHWVSVPHAVSAEVRLYEHLFTSPTPGNTPEGVEFTDLLNPDSMRVVTAQVEPALAEFPAGVPRAVRAPRVFLCRSGQQARCACLQQDCDAQGFVGEDRRQTIKKREEGSCLWSVL